MMLERLERGFELPGRMSGDGMLMLERGEFPGRSSGEALDARIVCIIVESSMVSVIFMIEKSGDQV